MLRGVRVRADGGVEASGVLTSAHAVHSRFRPGGDVDHRPAALADLAVDHHALATLIGTAILAAPRDGAALALATLALATIEDDLAIELVPEGIAERLVSSR